MKAIGMLGIAACVIVLAAAGCGRKEEGAEPVSLYELRQETLSDLDAAASGAVVDSIEGAETETAGEDTKADASSELALKSLTVNGVRLAVNIDSQDYRVGNEVSEVTVAAEPKELMASVISGNGTHALQTGINTIEIIVRGADDSRKSYVIRVIRAEAQTSNETEQTTAAEPSGYSGGGYVVENYVTEIPAEPEVPTVPPNDGVQILP